VNRQVKQVMDAWPLLLAVVGIMTALLTAYAQIFVSDIVDTKLAAIPAVNISVDPKIASMDLAIAANTLTIASLGTGQQEIKTAINDLEKKLDRTIEIMLTED